MVNKQEKKLTSKLFKFIILIFIPFYVAIAYYVYAYHLERIQEAKITRESLVYEIQSIEEKIKRESSKTPSAKKHYKQANPNTRLSAEVKEINSSIKKMITVLDNTKNKLSDSLGKSLSSRINEVLENNKKNENVVPELNIIKSSKAEVVGKGPTADAELNKSIEKTMELRNKLKEKLEHLDKTIPICQKKLDTINDNYTNIDLVNFNKISDAQWDVLNKISYLEHEISGLKKALDNLNNSLLPNEKDLESITSINQENINEEFVSSLSLSELNNIIIEQEEKISAYPEKISLALDTVSTNAGINFINSKDYTTLSNHFNKKIHYNKLISSHERISKKMFDERISEKKNLFIYLELATKRRIGIYIGMKFPKTTKFSKSYKDHDGFIVYFNSKEFYPALKDQNQQIRTDNDFLILVGNVKDNAGFWIKEKTNEEKQSAIIASFGMPSTQYDCLKGTLFSNPYTDLVVGIEVYELILDQE